jgi:hypothetical protein
MLLDLGCQAALVAVHTVRMLSCFVYFSQRSFRLNLCELSVTCPLVQSCACVTVCFVAEHQS